MLRNQRKGWIVPAALAALLLAPLPASAAAPARRHPGTWIVRLAAWLGLPPSVTAVWDRSSGYIDPLGQPKPAGTDSSAHIDPNG